MVVVVVVMVIWEIMKVMMKNDDYDNEYNDAQ